MQAQNQNLNGTENLQRQARVSFWSRHPQLKTVLFADKTTQTVEVIVQKHSLSPKQHIALSKIVMQVLSGELAPDKVASVLPQTVGTSSEISQQIIAVINKEIFDMVKEELDRAYQDIKSGVAPSGVAPSGVAPSGVAPSGVAPFRVRQRRLKPATPGSPAEARVPEETKPAPQPSPFQPQPPPPPTTSELDIPSPLAETIDEPPRPTAPNWPSSTEVSVNKQRTGPAPTNLPTDGRDRPRPVPTKDIRTLAKQNPKILEQQITSNYLKESGTGKSMPPTVRNWLLDYTKIAGATKHSSLDRGRYLFKSPNAKGLSDGERQTLSQILESYDENTPLKINPETGLLNLPKRNHNFRPQRSDEIRTFQVQPVSFGNIVDLQDF